jgi:PleD family two-component response regulator
MEKMNTVLLIDEQMVNDDDDFICSATEGILQKSGIANNIKVVSNTRDALDYLKYQCCGKEIISPEWIIFDDNLSQADCFEFLTAFENLIFSNKTDVLVIRLCDLSKEKQDSLRGAGVNKFMAKPLYPAEVKAVYLRNAAQKETLYLRKAS